MQANILRRIYYGVWYSAGNSKKLTQKPHFVVGIQNFLDHALFCPMGDAPIFGQMKIFMQINNPGKFHRYVICGCQIKYFQSLLYQQKVGFWAQIKSDLYKNFTSYAMQGKEVSNMLRFFMYS